MNAPVETKLRNGLPNLLHAIIARLPWLVLGLALIGTVAAWYMTRAAVLEAAKTGFDSTVSDAISKIQGRMRAYEQVLRGGVALFAAHGGSRSRHMAAVRERPEDRGFLSWDASHRLCTARRRRAKGRVPAIYPRR